MADKLPEKIIDNLYNRACQLLDKAKNNVYRVANFEMVQSYWYIGQLIVEEDQQGEQRAAYGKALVQQLSERLTKAYGNGYNERNLWYMKQFYSQWPILNALRSELSWTHYRLLLKVENGEARAFYLEEAIQNNWSTRTLERQINSLYHERILSSNKEGRLLVREEAESKQEAMKAKDIIKDPYVLEFLDLKGNPNFYEKELEQAIIEKLQEFLLELGKGFCFVERQKRISFEGEHFYIDLVFYNYILKCFLLIDLKTGKLTHQDIGQMDTYVRYFEDQIKQSDDNPTIGLILCTEKNKALAKYSLLNDNNQIFASKYKTYLPTEKELQKELELERKLIEQEHTLKE